MPAPLDLRELGEQARKRGDLPAAQQLYEQAVAQVRASGDRLRLAHTIRHLGDVHRQQQHWPDAESCYIEALEIYRGHPSPNPLDLANAIRPYALLKSNTGRDEEAWPLWTEARDLYQALGIDAGVEECSRWVGGS
jgi:tetratricopeptide (TPR) repeat protein